MNRCSPKILKWIYHQIKSWERETVALFGTLQAEGEEIKRPELQFFTRSTSRWPCFCWSMMCWYLKQALSVYCHCARNESHRELPPPVLHICGADASAGRSAGLILNGAAFGLRSVTFSKCWLSSDLYSSGLDPGHEHGLEVWCYERNITWGGIMIKEGRGERPLVLFLWKKTRGHQ